VYREPRGLDEWSGLHLMPLRWREGPSDPADSRSFRDRNNQWQLTRSHEPTISERLPPSGVAQLEDRQVELPGLLVLPESHLECALDHPAHVPPVPLLRIARPPGAPRPGNLHSHTVDGPPSLPTVHKGNKRWPRRVFSASGRHRRKYESVWSGADEAQRVPGSDRRRGLPAIYAIVEAQPGIRLVREVRPNLGQGGAPRNLVSVQRVPSTGRGMLRAVPGVLVLP